MITIGTFEDRYLEDLYAITLATGDKGEDASGLYEDGSLIGHIYSGPYAVLKPSLVLLAMDEQGVAGYAVGVTDTLAWEDRLEREWWPGLRQRYADPGPVAASDPRPERRLGRMIHAPNRAPASIVRDYPAHLHLNLLKRARGSGVGPRLLEAWLDLAAGRGARAAHVGVHPENERGIRFWSRSGFRRLEPEGDQIAGFWMGRTINDLA